MRFKIGIGFLACLAVTACSVDSNDPPKKELKRTSSFALEEMAGSYGAFSDGKRLELFVAFLGDGFLLLGEGDSVALDMNGTNVPLTERIDGDKVHYVGEVASPPAEPVVTITFSRGEEKVVAKNRLAPAFEPKAPPTTAKVGDKVALDLEPRPDLTKWQSALGPLIKHAVEVHGDCIEKGTQKFELEGKYPLEWDTTATKLVAGSNGCELDVQMRLETGAPPYEGKFKGGAFDGLQHRRFKVALTK